MCVCDSMREQVYVCLCVSVCVCVCVCVREKGTEWERQKERERERLRKSVVRKEVWKIKLTESKKHLLEKERIMQSMISTSNINKYKLRSIYTGDKNSRNCSFTSFYWLTHFFAIKIGKFTDVKSIFSGVGVNLQM